MRCPPKLLRSQPRFSPKFGTPNSIETISSVICSWRLQIVASTISTTPRLWKSSVRPNTTSHAPTSCNFPMPPTETLLSSTPNTANAERLRLFRLANRQFVPRLTGTNWGLSDFKNKLRTQNTLFTVTTFKYLFKKF